MLFFKINNIRDLFVKGASLALIVMSVFIGYFWITGEYQKFEEQSENIGRVHLDSQKSFVKNEVQKIVDYLEYKKDLTEQILKNDIKERVESVHEIAMNIYLENHKTCSDDVIKKMIRDALRPIRFNNGRGYFFAVSMDGVEELYPTRPEFEGANVLELQDSKGNLVIQDEIMIIRKHGEGYVRDYWPKPDEDPEIAFPKISFVKYFAPLDWYFGTGEYLDDIDNDIRQEVLQYIKNIRFDQDGYIFINMVDKGSVYDLSGSSAPREDIFELLPEEEIHKSFIYDKQVLYPEGTYISYDWIKPTTNTPSPKISYIRAIPDWGWVIGAGFYVDDINNTIYQNKRILQKNVISNLLGIIAIFMIGFALTLIIAQNYSKKINRELDAFTAFFLDAAQKNRKISKEDLSLDEFKTLADSVNIMVAEKERVENELKENKRQLENLTSGVDGYLWSADIDDNNIVYQIYTENIVKITGYEAEQFL
ncbi:MAG: cache domain-containing protein, partial [Deltaproteobacteria bacterium]|nr:cache domain-containing protein [Deltaproteobacteria bacterium]